MTKKKTVYVREFTIPSRTNWLATLVTVTLIGLLVYAIIK